MQIPPCVHSLFLVVDCRHLAFLFLFLLNSPNLSRCCRPRHKTLSRNASKSASSSPVCGGGCCAGGADGGAAVGVRAPGVRAPGVRAMTMVCVRGGELVALSCTTGRAPGVNGWLTRTGRAGVLRHSGVPTTTGATRPCDSICVCVCVCVCVCDGEPCPRCDDAAVVDPAAAVPGATITGVRGFAAMTTVWLPPGVLATTGAMVPRNRCVAASGVGWGTGGFAGTLEGDLEGDLGGAFASGVAGGLRCSAPVGSMRSLFGASGLASPLELLLEGRAGGEESDKAEAEAEEAGSGR